MDDKDGSGGIPSSVLRCGHSAEQMAVIEWNTSGDLKGLVSYKGNGRLWTWKWTIMDLICFCIL
eukprot:CAMPEP_0182451600 /NCGR_PEP_ID=MMETSP1172-20130603/43805_1 /TAXON_ID=708627 /ORGANISM="Timspurckia oligopyrenoides, Strain CCMP3278" /LENGTH=63 /DNA_ID=CAMNT_0024649383 /DNA_START=1003 /DNA_END=1194 /DNA_ORIENTATION=-